jgi:hypothetical protein
MPLARYAVLAIGLLAASLSHAASQRTFVSTLGVNNPSCFINAPCRDFASAIAATSPNGEIVVLDSGGYGSVPIAQSVSIIAPPGVYAGISVFAGDGVTIAAGPTGKVTLRGLTINGQGGSRGIVVTSAGEVHIEQCIVANMNADGIRIDGGARVQVLSSLVRSNGQNGLNVAAGTPDVRVIDSQFSRNASHGIWVAAGTLDAERIAADQNGFNGVRVQPASTSPVTVTLSDSAFTGNTLTGAVAIPNLAGATARLAIVRSTSAGNGGGGFGTNTFDSGTAFLTVSDSAAVENNGNGVIVSGTNATGIVGGSTIARNTGPDFDQGGGALNVLRSSGNNTLTGRGVADVNGTITPNPLK